MPQIKCFSSVVLAASILCGYAVAQTARPQAKATRVDDLVVLSRQGNSRATTELSRQLFRNAAISADMADALGFTDRITAAETSYRRGERPAIAEVDVAKAINNLADVIGAPSWVKTDTTEIRKVRMSLLVTAPHLVADQDAPDEKGRYKALSDKIGPMEASYIVTSLLFQKAFNSEYQISNKERAQFSTATNGTGPATAAIRLNSLHEERTKELQNLLQGRTRTLSVRDLLSASDHLFSDLSIEATPASGAVALGQINSFVTGGR